MGDNGAKTFSLMVMVGLVVFLNVRVWQLQGELKEAKAKPSPGPVISRCEEDEALVGAGDFEDGRWTAYVCGGAADDYSWGASERGTAKWLCDKSNQRKYYFEVEPTACEEL